MSARRKPAPPGGDADGVAELGRILDQRPILVAVAGPNGAGKTTFFHSHLKPAGLRFLNADEVARELDVDAYGAARVVRELREELVKQRESFVFETVLSDPVGEKVSFSEGSRAGRLHGGPLLYRPLRPGNVRATRCHARGSRRARCSL